MHTFVLEKEPTFVRERSVPRGDIVVSPPPPPSYRVRKIVPVRKLMKPINFSALLHYYLLKSIATNLLVYFFDEFVCFIKKSIIKEKVGGGMETIAL